MLKRFQFIGLFLFSILSTTVSAESDPASQVTKLFEEQMGAIASSDYEKFMDNTDANFRTAISPAQFETIAKTLSGTLKSGYESDYLGTLNQQGFVVHLWKVEPSQSENDLLVKMALQGEKIAGFWIQ